MAPVPPLLLLFSLHPALSVSPVALVGQGAPSVGPPVVVPGRQESPCISSVSSETIAAKSDSACLPVSLCEQEQEEEDCCRRRWLGDLAPAAVTAIESSLWEQKVGNKSGEERRRNQESSD